MRISICVLVSLSFVVVACSGKENVAKPAASEAKSPATEVVAKSVAKVPEPTLVEADVSESEAKSLLDTWLAAQNEGDLESYTALYADKFYGVKRSGERTYTFDHDGWIENRGRMFKKPMTVEAKDVSINVGAKATTVTFSQTWASGTYSDVGDKRLVLVKSNEDVRIAREEMLSSELARGGVQLAPVSIENFGFVSTAGDTHYLIIAKAAGDLAQGKTLHADSSAMAIRAANAATEAKYKKYVGQKARIYSAADSCAGTTSGVFVLREWGPHFGTAERMQSLSPEQLAAQVWNEGSEGQFVALAIKPSGCKLKQAARWGHVGSDSVRPFMTRRDDNKHRAAAIAQLEGSAEFNKVQKSVSKAGGPKIDLATDGAAISSWGVGDTTLVHVTYSDGGCGADWDVSISGTYLVGPDEKLLPVSVSERSILPLAVFDMNGDGTFEILSYDTLYRFSQGRAVATELGVPDYDCPC